MPATPLLIRQQIVRIRHEDNLTIGAIADIVKKSKGVIRGILKVYDDAGSCEARKSTGRPRKTSERDDLAIAKILKSDRFKTAATVSREFNAIMKTNLFRQTVSRRLAEHDLHARTPAVKPLISFKYKNIRHVFTTHHVHGMRRNGKRCIQ